MFLEDSIYRVIEDFPASILNYQKVIPMNSKETHVSFFQHMEAVHGALSIPANMKQPPRRKTTTKVPSEPAVAVNVIRNLGHSMVISW